VLIAASVSAGKQFVIEGTYFFITGRRATKSAAAVKETRRHVTGVQADVSNPADLDCLFAQILRETWFIAVSV
jgi:NAD(P)-dependent dehydrogenase (short-subunit alcohol dehydrogenase family)